MISSTSFIISYLIFWDSQETLVVKHPPANAGNVRDMGSILSRIPWRRAWQLTPVILPGESHGQRGLVGFSLQGHKESNTTEATEYI